jgi:uncharacterized protein
MMAPDNIDWTAVEASLDQRGYAVIGGLLSAEESNVAASLYPRSELFRSEVVMQRHGYGRGTYRYFRYPLPDTVQALRTGLYPPLARIANRWRAALGEPPDLPAEHAAYLARCHAAGQTRPTPLLLTYQPGDYNCLHQDLYGAEQFPLQVAILLSRPGDDFTGGEFVLVEQRPRMQSRPHVVPLARGDAVVFAVNTRPVQGSRGVYRLKLRHGVSEILAGQRRTLGVIFHDAA